MGELVGSSLRGRAAVVTGGGSGIGAAIARRAAQAGMHVVLADLDEARLDEVRARIAEESAHDVLAVPTDVRDATAVAQLADRAYEAFGSVAMLVNNAGIEAVGRLWDLSPETWDRVQDVNVGGVFNGIRAFVPRMGVDPAPSHIVNVSSIGALASMPLNAAYIASKHAVLSVTECLYLECAEDFPQIAVSVVCPAAVTTRIYEDAIGESAAQQDAVSEELARMRTHLRRDGLRPEQVAETVLTGALAGDFWITPHPERFATLAARRARMLQARQPPGASARIH